MHGISYANLMMYFATIPQIEDSEDEEYTDPNEFTQQILRKQHGR